MACPSVSQLALNFEKSWARPRSHRSVAITALIGAQLRIRKKSSDPE